jgi:hypothetical protein
MFMNFKKLLVGTLTAAFLLTGCGASNEAETPKDPHDHANTDLRETTASIEKLPTFLDKVDPNIKTVYAIAGANLDTIKHMPCYCGCGESAGHKDNSNCFIKEVNTDGSVVWDDHGTRCGTCMEIAVIASKMKQDGGTLKEIRTFIDEKYKEGYAKPTPTPMPS